MSFVTFWFFFYWVVWFLKRNLNAQQLRDGVCFDFNYKKREPFYSQKFSYNTLNFHLTYFSQVHRYTEFHVNFWKIINCLIWKFKCQTEVYWVLLLKLSMEILLFPLKWKLNLFTLKGMCVKTQKIMSCSTNL